MVKTSCQNQEHRFQRSWFDYTYLLQVIPVKISGVIGVDLDAWESFRTCLKIVDATADYRMQGEGENGALAGVVHFDRDCCRTLPEEEDSNFLGTPSEGAGDHYHLEVEELPLEAHPIPLPYSLMEEEDRMVVSHLGVFLPQAQAVPNSVVVDPDGMHLRNQHDRESSMDHHVGHTLYRVAVHQQMIRDPMLYEEAVGALVATYS